MERRKLTITVLVDTNSYTAYSRPVQLAAFRKLYSELYNLRAYPDSDVTVSIVPEGYLFEVEVESRAHEFGEAHDRVRKDDLQSPIEEGAQGLFREFKGGVAARWDQEIQQ